MKNTHKQSAFTLIELIIVIAIIAILAAAIFVAVDPARRLNQSRNSRRSTDIATMLQAIIQYQVDNSGDHIATINALPLSDTAYYMIGTCEDGDINSTYDTTDPAGDATPAGHTGAVNAPAAGEVDHTLDNCDALGVALNVDVGGDNQSAFHDANATDDTTDAFCLDISEIATSGYIAQVPRDPSTGTDDVSRYGFARLANGSLQLLSCQVEGEGPGGGAPIPEISVMR